MNQDNPQPSLSAETVEDFFTLLIQATSKLTDVPVPSAQVARQSDRHFYPLFNSRFPQARTDPQNFDYEAKCPPTPPGRETDSNARVWATFLDEHKTLEHDKLDLEAWRNSLANILIIVRCYLSRVA